MVAQPFSCERAQVLIAHRRRTTCYLASSHHSNPDSWQSPEPIIHACLYYATCPTREGLEHAGKQHMTDSVTHVKDDTAASILQS
jgi:hypothetical protein